MTRKILATTMLGAALVVSTGAAAQAAEDAYPPVGPTSSSTSTTAPPAPVAPDTNNQSKNTDVLGTKTEAQTDTSTLPRTGAEWMATAALGAGLLAGGAGLVVASRRRQDA